MGESNARKLRKQIAKNVVDERFTIQTELDNLTTKINEVDLKSLKKLSYHDLRLLREAIQAIGFKIKDANYRIDNISTCRDFSQVIEGEDGERILFPDYEMRLIEEGKRKLK